MKSNGTNLTEEQKQNKIHCRTLHGKFMSSLGFEWETDLTQRLPSSC